MIRRLLVVPAVLAVSLAPVGCATKTFVRQEIGKSESKTGEAVSRVGEDLGQARTQVAGLRTATTEASRRADEAHGLAGQAASKADQALSRASEAAQTAGQALARADQTDGRLTRLWNSRTKRALADTIIIRFGFDRWHLDDQGETALLEVAKQLQDTPALVVDLEGYTDNVGLEAHNIQLSERRAEAVRRFLAAKGVDLSRIHSIGLGDIRPVSDNRTKEGREQNRRVALRLYAPATD